MKTYRIEAVYCADDAEEAADIAEDVTTLLQDHSGAVSFSEIDTE